jgi:hypothetical protein
MKQKRQLKMFKNPSIEYLKTLYNKSVSYLFDNSDWKSVSASHEGSSRKTRVLKYTKKSLKQFGDELNIFKIPVIKDLKIIYYKSMEFVFDNNGPEPQMASAWEDNFQFSDVPTAEDSSSRSEKELSIFKAPNIENLKQLYYKSIGKL